MFHRIDDWTQLDSPRYFRLAALLPAYSGAVQFALRVEMQKNQPPPTAPQQDPSSLHPASGGEPARAVNDLRVVAAMTAHPGFAGIEYEEG